MSISRPAAKEVDPPAARRCAALKASIPLQEGLYLGAKRGIDLVISLLTLVVLSPLLATIALLVKLDSPGPVLFVQTRIGKGGRPFPILKFRTMRHGLDDSSHREIMQAYVRGQTESSAATCVESSEHDSCLQRLMHRPPDGSTADEGSVFKPFKETEVTQLGRVLRRTSLDELPQLINVLRGEMSLVGPRPNAAYEVEEYVPWHRQRLAVVPGITGLAQIQGRSSLDFDSIVRYDIQYIRNRTIWLDLWILAQTALAVVIGGGAH